MAETAVNPNNARRDRLAGPEADFPSSRSCASSCWSSSSSCWSAWRLTSTCRRLRKRRRWWSDPAPTPAPAEAKQHKASAAKPGDEKEKEVADEMEVDLGEYSVTAFQSTSNTTLRIDFRLYGTVKGDNQKEFAKLMEENKHRFREQVLVTVRSANVSDLTDAGLGLMKRKILERANRTLGKPLLQSVVVSDFSFVEQ